MRLTRVNFVLILNLHLMFLFSKLLQMLELVSFIPSYLLSAFIRRCFCKCEGFADKKAVHMACTVLAYGASIVGTVCVFLLVEC